MKEKSGFMLIFFMPIIVISAIIAIIITPYCINKKGYSLGFDEVHENA